MADIRINALTSTAASTASDDYLAVDGSANGTRKLSAYSPTFGGNLTVSGAGWNTFAGSIATTGANSLLQASTSIIDHSSGTFRAIGYGPNTSTAGGFSFIGLSSNGSVGGTRFSIDSSGNSTFAGNLTVSGAGGVNVASNTKFWALNQAAYYYIPQSGSNTGDLDAVNGIRLLKGGTAVLTAGNSTDGNVTVTNNLTVSGTGVSSVGGSFGIGTTAPTTINGVANAFQQVANVTGSGTCALNITGTQAILSLVDSNASANVKWLTLTNSNGVSTLGVLNDAGSITQTGFQFFHSTGNFLFGTGNDAGNGKLQLATHTTSAGGIGFGTDTSLYRVAAGGLAIDHIGGAVPVLYLRENGTAKAQFYTNGVYGSALGTITALPLTLLTNSTTALTLDSSQRMLTAGMAAFGGTSFLNLVSWTNGASGFGADGFDKAVIGHLKSSTNGATIAGHTWPLTAWAPLNIAGTNLTFRTNGELIALTLDSSQNAAFAGNVLVAASKGIALNGQTNPAVHGISTSGNTIQVNANTGGVVNLGTASNGALFTLDGNGVIKTQGGSAITPANAFATGTAGMIQWDASYIYVCTAANTWKRVAIAAW